MVDFSHGHTHAQKHKFEHRLTPNVRLVQETSHAHQHQIDQRIDQELSQNIALDIDDESFIFDQMEPEESYDDHNEDYDKPADEYETGATLSSQDFNAIEHYDIAENLEQAVIQRLIGKPDQLEYALQCIDHYRVHGHFPEGTDPQLHQYLAALEKSIKYQNTPSAHPAFEVIVDGDRVEANAVQIGSNLNYIRGLGPLSTNAKNFIKALHDRNKILNDLAYYILEVLQGDIFRQKDFDTALRFLLPVSSDELNSLCVNSPFKIDVKYLSKLGDLLVSCPFGVFPLNLFLPNKAQLVRLWVNFAQKENRVTVKEQLYWIWNQIENRAKYWDSNDVRQTFISPLKKITIEDIKNSRKAINKYSHKKL
jgi:hypothetical protein